MKKQTTNSFDNIQSKMKSNAERALAMSILDSEKTLESAAETIIQKLLGINTNSPYDLRQSFTFLGSIDKTLDTMYSFYEATFGKEFNREDWIPKEEIKKTITVKELLEQLSQCSIEVKE